MRIKLSLLMVLAMCVVAHAADVPAAVVADPPADKANPARMAYLRIPSHGVLMNGLLYTAAGAGVHPAVVLFHGFPGNEQNLDLAQAIRRAGFDVMTLHYRGAWGSPGAFSFSHAIEDATAAVAFLRNPATASKYAIDSRRIFVAGHSMGGFMAASAATHEPAVAGLIMISAWDIGADGATFKNPAARQGALRGEFADDVIPLAGTTPDRLMAEAEAHASQWEFVGFAPRLRTRPVLLIGADDGLYPSSQRLGAALRQTGDADVTEIHVATDHAYSDHRIALESAVVSWLTRHSRQ